jgi:hypothetical protein
MYQDYLNCPWPLIILRPIIMYQDYVNCPWPLSVRSQGKELSEPLVKT